MNKFLNSKTLLQLAIGPVMIYVGVSIFLEPNAWVGFVPNFVEIIMPKQIALYLHGAGDILLGLWVLSGKYKFFAGWTIFHWLVVVTAVSGVAFWFITFRDIGLALAALAYAYVKEI